jgi:hypothetical protein
MFMASSLAAVRCGVKVRWGIACVDHLLKWGMTVNWARGGPDLFVALDRAGGQLGTQIQDQLRAAIRDRRISAGERLPSTRHLAELLGVSRGIVVEAYEQLFAEGYVESAIGSGTRVATMPAPARRAVAPTLPVEPAPPVEIDFEYGIPDLGTVPLTDWSWAVSEATRTLPTAQLGDEDPGARGTCGRSSPRTTVGSGRAARSPTTRSSSPASGRG